MKKLLLIVLVFLLMGAVCAHGDANATQDHVLGDSEYTSSIDDDGKTLEVGEEDYIPIGVDVDEAYSLNVYIDKKESVINGDMDNVTNDRIDLATSVVSGDDEVPLGLGKHSIVYEFKFTNTTSIYKPEAFVSDSTVYFQFNFVRSTKNPQNAIYRFTSQFNIIQGSGPISQTLDLGEVNITQSDSLSFTLKGLSYTNVDIYIDDEFFDSFETDENPFEDEIDTSKLPKGSYGLLCIVETEKVRGEYNVEADGSKSTVAVKFTRSKITTTQNKYIITINGTLNVVDAPELNIINVTAPPVEVKRTRSVPIRFEGEDGANLTVYIDGEKVYENSVLFTWENTVYIPTKDSAGKYFNEGDHELTFEFVMSDKYARFKPEIANYNDVLTFTFVDSHDTTSFVNDKYVIKSRLTVTDDGAQFIPIKSDAKAKIVHTNDLNIKLTGLDGVYNLTVFVDDVELYDESTDIKEIAVKTFLARSSIEETNERDVKVGEHSLRFEYAALYECDVDVEFKKGVMNFKFTPKDSTVHSNGVRYQFNTTLTVTEKPTTVHIKKVKNYTYFDDTEFVVMMDLYEPDDDDDDDDVDDDEPLPVGTQDVGIIVSDANGEVYRGDHLMNVYDVYEYNYEFENEILSKPGTYTMKIINLADNTYDTAKFTVKKVDRTFNRKYTSDDFEVLFTLDFSSCRADLNSPCTIELDGAKKTINVKKGSSGNKKEVLFEDVNPGTYTAKFTLKGNDIYNDAVLTSKVTVKKENPEIKYRTGSNSVVVEIDIGKSKTDGELTVKAGGIVKKFKVDKNTKSVTADFSELSSGSYDVDIEFEGNSRYYSKTVDGAIEISHQPKPPVTPPDVPPAEEKNNTGGGVGNNTGGIGTGTGDANVAGSGNGTYNGQISFNGKGFDGNLGTQGSGSGDGSGEGPKGYEITKNVAKEIDNANAFIILLIAAIAIWILGFLYERRDDEEEEY